MPIAGPISLRSPTYPELELRTATLDDIPAVRDIFTSLAHSKLDPAVQDPAVFTHEKVSKMVEGWTQAQSEEKPSRVSIILAVNGVAQGIGGMGHIATNAETGSRTGDAGVVLNEGIRRCGYGTEAMRLTTDFAFDVLKLDKVTVTTQTKNTPMVALMEKMGWDKVHNSTADSEFGCDEYMYTMLPGEWAKRRRS